MGGKQAVKGVMGRTPIIIRDNTCVLSNYGGKHLLFIIRENTF